MTERGYVLLESLVALAVFAALAVTTADVARRAFRAGEPGEVPDLERVMDRFRPPVREGTDVRRINTRILPNGDRWLIYRYETRDDGGSVRVPVLSRDGGGTVPFETG